MGNNTSSTRKSIATVRHSSGSVRKSTATNNHHNLDEEFSDLILHQVKKKQEQQQNILIPVLSQNSQKQNPEQQYNSQQQTNDNNNYSIPYNQFSNDLIEDEFNELNDGLIETDATEVSRNILPNDDGNSDDDNMEIDRDETTEYSSVTSEIEEQNKADVLEETPTPDLSKVDFTKIAVPENMSNVRVDNSYINSKEVQPSHIQKKNKLISVEIKWVNSTKENINKISIIGSFSNWRDVIRLKPSPHHENEYFAIIRLPLGVHKLLYIINNEYRVSDQLPTATDQEGIFFNWFEVLDEAHLFNHSQNQPNHIGASSDYDANIINDKTQTAGKFEVDRINKKSNSFLVKVSKETQNYEHIEYSNNHSEFKPSSQPHQDGALLNAFGSPQDNYVPYHEQLSSSFLANQDKSSLTYTNEIPEMFVNYDYFKNKSPNYELPEPPQLPAHLNNVLLNKISSNQQQNHAQNIPQFSSNDSIRAPMAPFAQDPSTPNRRPPLRRADSSYYASNKEAYHLSIPNHVILNHLMTTSIRNDVLTVACITRYSGKFVTQIMHSPADT